MEKKLFRNEHDKMIAGVASGLAEYLQVEVTIVRLLFVLSTIFMAGAGLLAYLIIWVIAPAKFDPLAKFSKFNDYYKTNNPSTGQADADFANWNQPVNDPLQNKPFETYSEFSKLSKNSDSGRTIIGLVLIIAGSFFLMRQFDIIPDWFRFRNVWPVIFIVLGVSVIANSKNKNDWKNWQKDHDFSGQGNQAQPEPPKSDIEAVDDLNENKPQN